MRQWKASVDRQWSKMRQCKTRPVAQNAPWIKATGLGLWIRVRRENLDSTAAGVGVGKITFRAGGNYRPGRNARVS